MTKAHIINLNELLKYGKFDKVIYLSSTRVYDDLTAKKNIDEDAVLSVSPLNKRHIYDISKLMGEALCMSYQNQKCIVLRLSNVFNDKKDKNSFLSKFLNKISKSNKKKSIYFNFSPYSARDYIHLSDVLKIIYKISKKGNKKIYNVCSGEMISNLDLSKMVKRCIGAEIKFNNSLLKSSPPKISNDLIKEDLGIKLISQKEHIFKFIKEYV